MPGAGYHGCQRYRNYELLQHVPFDVLVSDAAHGRWIVMRLTEPSFPLGGFWWAVCHNPIVLCAWYIDAPAATACSHEMDRLPSILIRGRHPLGGEIVGRHGSWAVM